MKHISLVIEKVLKRLNITCSAEEKEKLAAFPEKAVYKAMDKFCQTEAKKSVITNAFTKLYLLCLTEEEKLNNEKKIIKEEPKKIPEKKVRKVTLFSGTAKKSYTHGKQYFKHGNWYKYPDQAIHEDFRPCMPYDSKCTENCGACNANKRINRRDINPEDELRKAIQSGKMNMKGLSFLRHCFLGKPELLTLIDGVLAIHTVETEPIEEAPKLTIDERSSNESTTTIEDRQSSLLSKMRAIGNMMFDL